jgi:membrane protein implicated in regulation of membrane protease activity
MLDTIFSITALVGGTVLGFQFVMMLLGLAQHGAADMGGSHDFTTDGADGFDGSLEGDATFDGDAAGGHDSSWGHSTDGDVSHHDGNWFYEVISIRTLAAAGTIFGLVGKTMLAYGHTPLASFVYAALAGAAALYGVYWLFKQVYRLQNAGNENVRRAIGLPATVYVPIPGGRSGQGKVMFRLQDRTVEYLAVTNESDRLATGEKVVIVGIVNAGTVRVARQTQEAPVEAPT